MLVWKGKGIAALIIPVVGYLIVNSANDMSATQLTKPMVNVVAAMLYLPTLIWFYKKYGVSSTRTVIDIQNNEELVISDENSMFWIDLKWWAYIIVPFLFLSIASQDFNKYLESISK